MDQNVIASVPLFSALDSEDQAQLFSMMSTVSFRRGEKLFNEGDPGNCLYLLVDGKVKLGHTSSDGRENLIAILGPGEMIGELTLFDPGPRSGTATAVAPTEMLQLDHTALMDFVDTRPELAKHMLKALAQRLRRTNTALADLVFSDVPGRVAKALLDLSTRFGEETEEGVRVAHEAFADDVIEKNDGFLVETVPLPQPQGFAVVAERALCCTPNRRERSA